MKKLIMSIAILASATSLVCVSQAQTSFDVRMKSLEALGTPVKQQKIADCYFQSSDPISFGTGTMVTDPGGKVTLSGVDQEGKTWTASYEDVAPGAGCELWQGDLGNNGRVDLIFVQHGMNSSGGWDTTLSLLLFDGRGRPFPWQALAKFTIDKSGVRELIQLEDVKRPLVIVPEQKDTDRSNDQYSYHAYTFTGIRATELAGTYGGVAWPLYDYPPIQNSTDSASAPTLTTSGKSIDEDETPPTILVYQGTLGATDSERQLVMSNKGFSLPDVLVLDNTAGRRIYSQPTKSDLDELQINRAKGIVLGNNCTDRACHPLVVWLKQ